MKRPVTAPPPYLPPEWLPADASAIQALVRGDATPEQQHRAINWVVYAAAATNDLEYRTEDRDHAFASGRRFVGLQINKMIGINVNAIVNAK